jgi:predicted dehydrogenase
MPYKVAIIGLGRISSTIDDEVAGNPEILLPYSHMGAYRAAPEVEVVAAADLYAEQREAFRERWGVDRLYEDYREMLEREKPDIVSVTTATKPRPAIVMDCARAGVRLIYAEKPIAFSLAEADAMVATCHEQGAKLAIGCCRRWNPFLHRGREMVAAGAIGRVLQITVYGQARISHNGSHLIDMIRYFAGDDVQWVFGEMESDERAATDDDLMGNGYLAFANGMRAYVRMMPTGGADQFEVLGETGRLRFTGWGAREIEFDLLEPAALNGRGREMSRRVFPRPQRIESDNVGAVRDFVRCLESDKYPDCTGEDGRAALEVALAMRESHRQGGRQIALPLTDRSLTMRSWETLSGDLPRAMARAQPST